MSAVTTRGLEITLPRPSSSRALNSRFSTLVTPLLNSVSPSVPGLKPFNAAAGRFTKFRLVICVPPTHVAPVGQVVPPFGSGPKLEP